MDYQKLLYDSNPSLYEGIKDKIYLMPDVRPMETIKQMRQEKQDSWRLIIDNLDAISYRVDHMSVLDAINKEEFLDIDDYEIMKEFVISYPGLLWVMWIINPDLTIPLIISQRKNLPESFIPLLDKIHIKLEYIYYLRDIDTAT